MSDNHSNGSNGSDGGNEDDAQLEHNLEQLLTTAHEPPRLSAQARGRILAELKHKARQATPPAAPQQVAPPRRAPHVTSRRKRTAAMILAAAACVALVWGVNPPPRGTPQQVQHENPTPGAAPIDLADGTRIVLAAGAELTELGPRHLRLAKGQALLDVAPAAGHAPFLIDTPEGRVTVLGTRFVLAATAGETRAAVVRGVVRIDNASGSVTLHAGEEGVLGGKGARPTRRPAPRLSHLTSWTRDAVRELSDTPAPVRNGALIAREPRWGQEWPLDMRQLTVDVHVENEVVRTTIDQTFFNHVDRQLEGVYSFPLPPGAAVSRLAMYVDGKLMEGGIVERQRGRDVYEGIVYQRRDPALLEWMQGNVFKVRIFPLPSRSEKRIILSYTQPLERLYDTARLVVPIPAVDSPVDDVRMNVRVVDGAAYDIASSSHRIETAADGVDRVVSFHDKHVRIGDDLVLTLSARGATPQRTATWHDKDGDYLMARVQPTFGGADAAGDTTWHKRRWVLLYDTSASRDVLDLRAQAYVVERLLGEWDEDDEVAVVAFDTTTRLLRGGAAGFRRVADADRQEIARFLADEGRDGVGDTNLAAAVGVATELLGEARARDADAGAGRDPAEPYILYLGDGMLTAGDVDVAALQERLTGRATFVGVSVGDRVDTRTLRTLADATGGAYASWPLGVDLSWHVFDLIAALNTPRVTGLSATLLDAHGLPIDGALVYASGGALAEGEVLTVLARLGVKDAAAARLSLAGMLNGKPWRLEQPLAEATRGAKYLPRLWAQARIEALLRDGGAETGDVARTQQEITALGMANFLITPHTSLLVLENDAMYKEFKVTRPTEESWAFYPAPSRIPVVHQPLDRLDTPGGPDDSSILIRSPVDIFVSPAGHDYHTLGFDQGIVLGATAGPRRLGVGGIGRGGGGTGTGRVGVLNDAFADKTLEKGEPNKDADAAGAENDRERSISFITTEELRDGKNQRWSSTPASSRPVSGAATITVSSQTRGGDDLLPVASPAPMDGRFAAHVSGKQGKGDFRYQSGYGGYYSGGYYNGGLNPSAFYYSSDPRLDDLTEFVPALFGEQADLERAQLLLTAASRKPGTISPAAQALFDEAWRRRGAERYHFADGETMSIDAEGRFVVDRLGSTKLAERISYDGKDLWSLYPELGLAVRRHIGVTEPALLSRWAPFALPRAAHLVRWYDLTVAPGSDGRTLRLTAPGAATDAVALEYELDSAYRLTAVRRVQGTKTLAEQRFEWSDGGVLVIDEAGTRTPLTRDAHALAVTAVDSASWTTVEMPLAQPQYWDAKVKAATPGSIGWRDAQRQLLAAYAALANDAGLTTVLGQLAAQPGTVVTRGELALASRAVRYLAKEQRTKLLAPLDKDDPVADWVRGTAAYYQSYRPAPLDRIASEHPGTLVGMLASYRGLLNRVEGYYNYGGYGPASRKEARRRVQAFNRDYGYAPFRFLAVWVYARNWQWQDWEGTVAMWDGIADLPEWRTYARYGAAAALSGAGKYDKAVERYEAAFQEAQAAGDHPIVDYGMHNAFYASSRGQAGWRLFWTRYRAGVVRSGDPAALAAFLQSVLMTGEHNDIGPAIGAFRGKPITDTAMVAQLADLLQSLGRSDDAWTLLRPVVDGVGKDDPLLLERASQLAEAQGRILAAARYAERAMDARAQLPTSLDVLRAQYRRLFTLRARLAQSLEGDTDPTATVDEQLAAAMAVAARWRRDDPDNVEIDRSAASLLFALGRPEEAWRQLATIIERHPGEGSAYAEVAGSLENEGSLEDADEVWERAARAEPTNPVWLFRRSQNMMALGREDEARTLLQIIVDGTWQDRFSDTVWQAKHAR